MSLENLNSESEPVTLSVTSDLEIDNNSNIQQDSQIVKLWKENQRESYRREHGEEISEAQLEEIKTAELALFQLCPINHNCQRACDDWLIFRKWCYQSPTL